MRDWYRHFKIATFSRRPLSPISTVFNFYKKYVPIFDERKSRKAAAAEIEEVEDRISCPRRMSGDKLKLK